MDLLTYRTIFSCVGFYFWQSSVMSAQIVGEAPYWNLCGLEREW